MGRIAATILGIAVTGSAHAVDLSGTPFDRAGQDHNIDPLLVYAVALAESGYADDTTKGQIAPWPWTLRAPSTPYYGDSLDEAAKAYSVFSKAHGALIDVGVMQVNMHWHGDKFDSIQDALDPEKNIKTGTKVLVEAINSSPHDLELGIGRYNTWKDEGVARNYGRRVLEIYKNLLKL